MPYIVKSQAELSEIIQNINSGNEIGEGLHNEENQIKLYSLSQMLKRAAQRLKPAETDKDMRELQMELNAVSTALDSLRNPNILKDSAAFEDAIRDISNFHDLMFKRTNGGRLYFDIIEYLGKDETYHREDFLGILKEINRHVDCGYSSVDKEVERGLSREAKEEYLRKKDVIQFKTNPVAQYVATLVNTDSRNYKDLKDVTQNCSYGRYGDLYACGRHLMELIDDLNNTDKASRKRELMMQAYSTFETYRRIAKKYNFRTNGFPENCMTQDVLDREMGRNDLDNLFDENNEMIVRQFKERSNPDLLELPKHVSSNMAVAFFAMDNIRKEKFKDNINPDSLTVARAMLSKVFVKGIEEVYSDSKGEEKTAIEPFYNSTKDFFESLTEFERNWKIKSYDGDKDKCEVTEEGLNNLAKKFEDLLKIGNEFVKNNNKNHPELVKKYRELCAPFIAKLKDYEYGLTKDLYQENILKIPQVKPEVPDYEAYEGDDKKIGHRNYISSSVAWKLYQNMIIHTGDAIVNDTKKFGAFKSKIEELQNRAKILAGNARKADGEFDFTIKTSYERDLMAKIAFRLGKIQSGCKNKEFSSIGEEILGLRNQLQGYVKDDNYSYEFRKESLKILNAIEPHFQKSLSFGDKFNNYIVAHTGYNATGPVDYVSVNAVAAYLWKHEQIKKNPGKNPKFSQSDIEKRAKKLMNTTAYKAFFEPSKAEIQAERKRANKNDDVFNEEKFREKYRKNKERMFTEASLVPSVVANFERPFAVGVTPEEQRKALRDLAELGQIMDRCSFWSSRQYKAFYYGLKDLARKDIDNMTGEEMGDLLKDLFDKTEAFMNGRKAVRRKPEQREHFEQTLDAMAIFSHLGKNGEALAAHAIDSTNTVRDSFGQSKVELIGRNAANSRIRLKKLRGELDDRRIVESIDLLKTIIDKKNYTRASMVYNNTEDSINKLPKIPKTIGKTINLEDEVAGIKNKLSQIQGNDGYVISNECIPKLVALNYVAAFKDGKNKAVISEDEYKKAIEIVSRHRATQELIIEFENKENVDDILNSINIVDVLKDKFNNINDKIKEDYAGMDKKALGAAYYASDEMIKRKITERYQKRVIGKIYENHPLKDVASLDDVDKQMDELDAKKLNKQELILFEEFGIDADHQGERVMNKVAQERKEEQLKQELKNVQNNMNNGVNKSTGKKFN